VNVTQQQMVKDTVDVASVATLVGTLIDILPAVAAVFTIVWTALRIYESPTIQGLLNRRKRRKQDHE
jgi:hypothetical protein